MNESLNSGNGEEGVSLHWPLISVQNSPGQVYSVSVLLIRVPAWEKEKQGWKLICQDPEGVSLGPLVGVQQQLAPTLKIQDDYQICQELLQCTHLARVLYSFTSFHYKP